MQLVGLFLVLFLVTASVYSFRDYPANYSPAQPSSKLKQNKACNCTVYEKPFEKLLSRRKRTFVFFKGTVLVLTNVMAKAILATSPKGIIQSNEVDLFYEVPLLVEGWRKPFDDFVKNMRAQMKIENESDEDEKLKNVGVVNASAIPLKEYYKMPFARPNWSRVDLRNQTNRKSIWNSGRRNFQAGHRRPYNRGPYNRNPSRNYYQNSPRRNYVQPTSYARTYTTSKPYEEPTYDYKRSVQDPSQDSSQDSSHLSENETPSWHHHREYRERRGIYDHIEVFGKMLGVKLRKCILRAICEMKEQLLPEGESFINDVARILFTVPTDHDNKDDEFTQMALEENVDCARRFVVSCPYSPLQYFFNNFRAADVQKQPEPTAQDIMNSIIYA